MKVIQPRLVDAHGPDVLVRLVGGPADGTVLTCPPLELPLDLYVQGAAPAPVITIAAVQGPGGLVAVEPPAGATRYLRRLNEDQEVVYLAQDLNVP
jgi:hypothetical protein